MDINSNEKAFQTADNSSIILGTSSDAIIEDLHNEVLIETASADIENFDDDKNKIVNQQDQNDIVNPVEKEYERSETGFSDLNAEKSPSVKNPVKDIESSKIPDDKLTSDDESKISD